MNRRSKVIILSLLAVFLLASCNQGGGTADSAAESGSADSSVPFDLMADTSGASGPLMAGGRIIPVYDTFADLEPIFTLKNDTTYVINFWATWCKPCVEELPYFERLRQETAGKKVRIILVSLDFSRDLQEKLVPFVEEKNLKSDVMVLLDGNYNEWIDKVDPQWGGAIPITIAYRGDQRRFAGQQLSDYEELKGMVEELL